MFEYRIFLHCQKNFWEQMIDLGNSTKCYKVTFFSKLENWHAVGGHCTDFTKFSWIFDLSSVLITFVFGNLLSQIEKCIFSGSFGFIHKDIFACLFSIHNTISLSCHEQVCLSGLRFERYFSHHRARWWEKYLSKRSPLKHTCSWHDKLIVILIKK